ncbi:MAG: hypothetical protein HYW24_01460 [Candidatus Aenigmarchaeota archaeon]|nr:hypothetical protein [Candidatus Aenigmarchaeota archaeon]
MKGDAVSAVMQLFLMVAVLAVAVTILLKAFNIDILELLGQLMGGLGPQVPELGKVLYVRLDPDQGGSIAEVHAFTLFDNVNNKKFLIEDNLYFWPKDLPSPPADNRCVLWLVDEEDNSLNDYNNDKGRVYFVNPGVAIDNRNCGSLSECITGKSTSLGCTPVVTYDECRSGRCLAVDNTQTSCAGSTNIVRCGHVTAGIEIGTRPACLDNDKALTRTFCSSSQGCTWYKESCAGGKCILLSPDEYKVKYGVICGGDGKWHTCSERIKETDKDYNGVKGKCTSGDENIYTWIVEGGQPVTLPVVTLSIDQLVRGIEDPIQITVTATKQTHNLARLYFNLDDQGDKQGKCRFADTEDRIVTKDCSSGSQCSATWSVKCSVEGRHSFMAGAIDTQQNAGISNVLPANFIPSLSVTPTPVVLNNEMKLTVASRTDMNNIGTVIFNLDTEGDKQGKCFFSGTSETTREQDVFCDQTERNKCSKEFVVKCVNAGEYNFQGRIETLAGVKVQTNILKVNVVPPAVTVKLSSSPFGPIAGDAFSLTMEAGDPNGNLYRLLISLDDSGDKTDKCVFGDRPAVVRTRIYECSSASSKSCSTTWPVMCVQGGTYDFKAEAQEWGLSKVSSSTPVAVSQPKVTLYDNANHQGTSIQSLTEPDLSSLAFQNRISSIKVPSEQTAVLYSDVNFGGAYKVLKQDTATLPCFDNKANSIKVLPQLYAPAQPCLSSTVPCEINTDGNVKYALVDTSENQLANYWKFTLQSRSNVNINSIFGCDGKLELSKGSVFSSGNVICSINRRSDTGAEDCSITLDLGDYTIKNSCVSGCGSTGTRVQIV